MDFQALALAFVVSAETMLTAAAIDKMSVNTRTNHNKELRAQEIGNVCSGFLGLLPITGVIARSGVNIRSGAKSRNQPSCMAFGLFPLYYFAITSTDSADRQSGGLAGFNWM
jgi:MFS superfamily sulfate permease-like transporter